MRLGSGAGAEAGSEAGSGAEAGQWRGLPCRRLHMERVSLALANETQADVRQTPAHCFAA